MPIRIDLTFSEYAAQCGYLGKQLAELPNEVLNTLDAIYDDVDLVEHPNDHPDNVYGNIYQHSTREVLEYEFGVKNPTEEDLEEYSLDEIVRRLEEDYMYLGYDSDEDIYYYM